MPQPHTYELRESNVRLRLTVVDTVGYGDQINKEDCWKPIVDYIDAQFEGENAGLVCGSTFMKPESTKAIHFLMAHVSSLFLPLLAYLQEELKIKRGLDSYHDGRAHACLYFIAPTGHSLKSLDLMTMKKLDSKVGVPVS